MYNTRNDIMSARESEGTTAEAIRSSKEDIKYEKKDSYVKKLYYGDQ